MSTENSLPTSYRPELPDWGAYLVWPIEGNAWIHPEDRERAESLIPSQRVFKRHLWDGEYYHLSYGAEQIRVLPSMWLKVPDVDLSMDQQVELLHREGLNDPGIFRISEILFSPEHNRVEYCLHGVLLKMDERFSREDLRPLHVKHELKPGSFPPENPTGELPDGVDLLDVGPLTDEQT